MCGHRKNTLVGVCVGAYLCVCNCVYVSVCELETRVCQISDKYWVKKWQEDKKSFDLGRKTRESSSWISTVDF